MLVPCVYIMASRTDGAIYTGVTSNPVQRIWQHKEDLAKGHTSRYIIHRLVWFELHETMESALIREKRIKRWKRSWKIRLIEEMNPHWNELYYQLCN
ncbi:MAG: GIY-YIG nuclease family protein [Chloroflexi bacterium]|nr:GIY-YIG nuclease family protein [Chloroflexota bacterium]